LAQVPLLLAHCYLYRPGPNASRRKATATAKPAWKPWRSRTSGPASWTGPRRGRLRNDRRRAAHTMAPRPRQAERSWVHPDRPRRTPGALPLPRPPLLFEMSLPGVFAATCGTAPSSASPGPSA